MQSKDPEKKSEREKELDYLKSKGLSRYRASQPEKRVFEPRKTWDELKAAKKAKNSQERGI